LFEKAPSSGAFLLALNSHHVSPPKIFLFLCIFLATRRLGYRRCKKNEAPLTTIQTDSKEQTEEEELILRKCQENPESFEG
jgi:hypothetical protein